MADLFCGAGGTSTGAVQAAEKCGFVVELTAINHWDVAIATHTQNHPDARHLQTSIDNVNPRDLFKPGELDVLWASPECTHHSVARGGAPIHDQSRATAWCVVRWAEALRPPIILVENVPEFQTWGPLDDRGRPLKTGKGKIYHAWLDALRALGYKVEAKVLCAADYGDPTTRKRLFVQAVRGRAVPTWPRPSHAKAPVGRQRAWRAAREIIDWDLKGRWIDEMPPKACYDGLPLSPNTIDRITSGFFKHGLKKAMIVPQHSGAAARSVERPAPTVTTTSRGIALVEPYLTCMEHGGTTRDIDRPIPTITTAKGGAISLVQPFLVELRGTTPGHIKRAGKNVDMPLGTVAANGKHHSLIEPYLVQVAHGNGKDEKDGNHRRAKSLEAPLGTVSGSPEWALIDAALLPQQSGGRLRSVDEPAPTVATGGAIALVEPYLVKYYGTAGAQSVDEPLDTVTTKDRHALVSPVIVVNGGVFRVRYRYRMLQPGELAGAQGFPKTYRFSGTKTNIVKQVGNSVPCSLAEALFTSALRGRALIK